MGKSAKRTIAANVMRLLRERAGDPEMQRKQAVTALVHLKIATGTAQRLLDETTDIQIGTLEDVAGKLSVTLLDLMSDRSADLAAPEASTVDCTPALLVEHLAHMMNTMDEAALDIVRSRLNTLAASPDSQRARDALQAALVVPAPAGASVSLRRSNG